MVDSHTNYPTEKIEQKSSLGELLYYWKQLVNLVAILLRRGQRWGETRMNPTQISRSALAVWDHWDQCEITEISVRSLRSLSNLSHFLLSFRHARSSPVDLITDDDKFDDEFDDEFDDVPVCFLFDFPRYHFNPFRLWFGWFGFFVGCFLLTANPFFRHFRSLVTFSRLHSVVYIHIRQCSLKSPSHPRSNLVHDWSKQPTLKFWTIKCNFETWCAVTTFLKSIFIADETDKAQVWALIEHASHEFQTREKAVLIKPRRVERKIERSEVEWSGEESSGT